MPDSAYHITMPFAFLLQFDLSPLICYSLKVQGTLCCVQLRDISDVTPQVAEVICIRIGNTILVMRIMFSRHLSLST